MQLFEAFNQWATRPNDERYWDVEDALVAAEYYHSRAVEKRVALGNLRASPNDGQIILHGRDFDAQLSNSGFEQVARLVGAPAGYLRTLPTDFAAEAINYGLKRSDRDGVMLFHQKDNGMLVSRCITTDKYERLFNRALLLRLRALVEKGWRTPPARPAQSDPRSRPATPADVLACCKSGIPVTVGMEIAPAGVYLSDHDMFVFLVFCDNPIDDGNGRPLYRGLMIDNNEVGTGSHKLMAFLFAGTCSNHIAHGAEMVSNFRLIHRKNIHTRSNQGIESAAHAYVNEGVEVIERQIKSARETIIAPNKDALIDKLFGQKLLTKSDLVNTYNYAVTEAQVHNTDPLTVWGFTQGLTKYSQTLPYAAARTQVDAAATKLLTMNF